MPKKSKKKARRMPRMNSSGFTLIELMVVVSIVSLIASQVLVSTIKARWQAIDTKRYVEALNLAKAMDLYYQDKGPWPILTKYLPPTNSSLVATNLDTQWKTELGVALKPAYIQDMPKTNIPMVWWQNNEGFMVYYVLKSLNSTQSYPKGGYPIVMYKPYPHIDCMFGDAYLVGTTLIDPADERINGRESWSFESYGMTTNFIVTGGNIKDYPAGREFDCERGL